MGIKAYIKDFQKSDAPQFKGKSKEKRRDQAVAAYLQAKDDMKEGKGTPRIHAKTYSSLNLKKARELMSPAKHREDGINRIAKGMGISKAKATKHHDDVMKSYGFKPESTKRVTQVSLDQAKRDLKMKKIQKKMKSLDEITVAKRNKYYDDAKKDIERAKSSAVGKILRGKEADGTRHDHSIELRRIKRREKGIKTARDQAIKNIRGELYKKKATKEGAFYGRDDMVKAFKDDDKKRGMVRVRKQDGNMTHTVTVKRNSADHKKYEKKGYKMDPYFNEMTIGQGVEVKKVPAGDPAPQGFKVKKLAKIHGGKFDVYHKEKPKVKDAVAGRTMYNDTTTEKLDHQDKPLVKKVVGMLKKASKAHAGQAKSLSKAMTDEGYIKSDKIYPHPQGNLTKMQRRALTALDKRAKKPVTLPGMDMLKKKEKEPTKVGRQSQVVRYEEKGRGPTGIAYSLPKGHPDAENPATRKKYPERQTPAYKKKFFGKDKSSASSVGMKENAFRPPHISLAHMNRMKKHNISFKQADDMLKKKNAKADKPKAEKNKVNEVSMNRLGNYIKKRTADIASAGSLMTGDYGIGPAEKKAKRMKGVRDYSRFDRGVKKAVDKMTGKAKVPATNEGMNSYMASTRSMQGVVHARDEDHAREIMRTKHGAKGKIDLRLKGPVSKTTRERRPLGPMDKQESTWYMPTSKEMVVLRNMMKRPIVLGENAENAIDNIPIGSDNLHKIFVAEAKKDPNTDARTMIESWLSDRLKHGDEEAEYLGIRLGLLEGYEADVSKFMNKHDIDHHWSGGKLHVDKKDEKRAMKKLSKKYGGYGPRGAKMMPQVHVNK
jgi:hypothetical protein